MRVLPALLLLSAFGSSLAPAADRGAFQNAMNDTMARMHATMMTGYSGDPDKDFAVMMVAHHQGAIDMARLELEHGKDERLRRLAHGIIVEQEQEIAVMKDILSGYAASPTSPESGAAGPQPHSSGSSR